MQEKKPDEDTATSTVLVAVRNKPFEWMPAQAHRKFTFLANPLNFSSVVEHNDNDSDMETWLQPCKMRFLAMKLPS
ncbi:MAG: hypothetical protein ACLQVJ_21875 [Syntrophobacteraceae bacterium]